MARTPFRPALLVAVSAAFLLAGCGASGGSDAAAPTTTEAEAPTTTTAPAEITDTPETTEATQPAGDDICVPLKVLSDYDIESARLITAGDWAAIQLFFEEQTDEVLVAYDEAIALNSEVTADLEELRAITAGTAELATGSNSLSDLSGQLLALPGITSAGEAGFRLNTFAEENCGFSTGGNGQ